MKLLLDENLSRRIIPELQHFYPESSQVALIGLNAASDREIWEYAKQENFAIVSQDADFHEYNLLAGGPPLVIWLRCGNQPKKVIFGKLTSNKNEIEEAYKDPEIWCIEIY